MSTNKKTSNLLKVMALLYQYQPEEVIALQGTIVQRRIQAWMTALATKAREYGCGSNTPKLPSGRDATELDKMAKFDATSIAKTWDRDVLYKLLRLYENNPKGNRNYYAKNMEIWVKNRDQWKLPQIAITLEQSTRHYAQLRFYEENKISPKFVYSPSPRHVSDECKSRFSAGVVGIQYVKDNPVPAHPNCPHDWIEVTTTIRIDCKVLWLG